MKVVAGGLTSTITIKVSWAFILFSLSSNDSILRRFHRDVVAFSGFFKVTALIA